MLKVYRYCVDIVRMLRAVLLLTVLLALSPPSSAWYPYYRPFPFVRRPARPHNPIIVQADRVKVDNRDGNELMLLSHYANQTTHPFALALKFYF